MTAINDVVDLTIEDGLAVVTIDYPPVNALSPAVMEALYDGMLQALGDDAVQAIVLICAGQTFIAGADLKSLGKVQSKVDFFDLQERIENASKPTVAALHGTALGGGLEVALTFHYRIAVPSAQMGLPEVKLGLLPGGGGTQRLPRIVGAVAALDMMTTGRSVKAPEALALGLVDALAEEGRLRPDALAFAGALVAERRPLKRVRDLEDKVSADRARPTLFDDFRRAHAERLRGLEAPQAIIRCVEAAVNLPFAESIAVERREFQPLLASQQSAALRHIFMAERAAAKVPDLPRETAALPIRSVAVLGSGESAQAIAQPFAAAGLTVRVTEQAADLADCDLVIEAAPDDLAAKTGAVATLLAVARPDAVVASSTSSLDLDQIANGSDRVVGLNLLADGKSTRLVEIVRGKATSPTVLATALALAKRIGRTPVVAGARTGFIGARMLAAARAEAERLIARGVQPDALERILYDYGFPAGAFKVAAAPGAASSGMGDAEIRDQFLAALADEGARLVDEGIALRASDIDVLWVVGYGFPAYRGGPMFQAGRA